MKKETGIALGVGAIIGAYFLNQKLNPPKLIIHSKDESTKSAEVEFDGTKATVSVNTVVDIPGRNNKALKAYGNSDGSVINLDLWKDGQYLATLQKIYWG